jgi:hypothetical protein
MWPPPENSKPAATYKVGTERKSSDTTYVLRGRFPEMNMTASRKIQQADKPSGRENGRSWGSAESKYDQPTRGIKKKGTLCDQYIPISQKEAHTKYNPSMRAPEGLAELSFLFTIEGSPCDR